MTEYSFVLFVYFMVKNSLIPQGKFHHEGHEAHKEKKFSISFLFHKHSYSFAVKKTC